MAGVNNQHLAIWLAAMTAGINFVFTLVGVWLVERIGRKRLLLCSLAGMQHTTLSYCICCRNSYQIIFCYHKFVYDGNIF